MKATILSLLVLTTNKQLTVAFTPLSIQSERRITGTKTSSLLVATQDTPLAMFEDKTHSAVTDYYGKTLQKTEDLQTNACCTSASPLPHIKSAISKIHPDVIAKYYGCGFCVPDEVEGKVILDLGCGAGRDVYIASQLVGKNGRVIGVDMTAEQLQVAKETQSYPLL